LHEGGIGSRNSTLSHCRVDVNCGIGDSDSASGADPLQPLGVDGWNVCMKINTRQYIFGGCLARMIEKIICEIDLVIVVLSDLGEYGHMEPRRTIDIVCRFFVYSKS